MCLSDILAISATTKSQILHWFNAKKKSDKKKEKTLPKKKKKNPPKQKNIIFPKPKSVIFTLVKSMGLLKSNRMHGELPI